MRSGASQAALALRAFDSTNLPAFLPPMTSRVRLNRQIDRLIFASGAVMLDCFGHTYEDHRTHLLWVKLLRELASEIG